MITAVHNLVYAEDADAARAFFRDVLGWPNVDAHGGWLIFKTGPSELGVHPAASEPGGPGGPAGPAGPGHEISLMCDDITATVAELTSRGAEFTQGITQARFGQLTRFKIPGAGEMVLYQPSHPAAYDL
jgi:predicted enzyme related to lactoylglutathione lyase